VSAGVAPRVLENAELSDIETFEGRHCCSGSEAVAGTKRYSRRGKQRWRSYWTPIVENAECCTLIVKFAELLNRVFIPFARTRTE